VYSADDPVLTSDPTGLCAESSTLSGGPALLLADDEPPDHPAAPIKVCWGTGFYVVQGGKAYERILCRTTYPDGTTVDEDYLQEVDGIVRPEKTVKPPRPLVVPPSPLPTPTLPLPPSLFLQPFASTTRGVSV
jgi:hypothetical protein